MATHPCTDIYIRALGHADHNVAMFLATGLRVAAWSILLDRQNTRIGPETTTQELAI
jgi:hypothetical protein